MGLMDNFKQALSELTGLEEEETEENGAQDEQESATQFRSIDRFDEPEESVAESRFTRENDNLRAIGDSRATTTVLSDYVDAAVRKPMSFSSGSTVIASGTIIDGNVTSNEDLLIHGVVNGDVLNARKLVIHGKVSGGINATDISLVDCVISGNVAAANSVEMTKDSCILGDLITQNVVVSGKVKGNIEAQGSGVLKRDSIVLGNISVGTIVIEAGAKIRGFITTTDGDKEVDEDLFPAS